jgi:Ca2+-binding EF-hand superfamily protein
MISSIVELIKQFDSNKDGKVTLDELLGAVEKFFIGK